MYWYGGSMYLCCTSMYWCGASLLSINFIPTYLVNSDKESLSSKSPKVSEYMCVVLFQNQLHFLSRTLTDSVHIQRSQPKYS